MTHERCPTCQQSLEHKKLIRVCWDCKGQIRTHHKYVTVEREVAPNIVVQQVVHRYCPSPTSYMSVDDYLKQSHHPYMHDSLEKLDKRREKEAEAKERILKGQTTI